MAKDIMWGNMPFNFTSLCSEGMGKDAKQWLVEKSLALKPSNGKASAKGNKQCKDDGFTSFVFAVFTFVDNKLVGQIRKADLESILNLQFKKEEELEEWDKLKLVVINCEGNSQLEYMAKNFQKILLTSNVEIDHNNNLWKKPAEDLNFKELEEDEISSELEDALQDNHLPYILYDSAIERQTLKSFRLDSILGLDELVEIAGKIDFSKSKGDEKKSYSGKGNTYLSYESSLEKFKNLLKILGLPENSTAKDVIKQMYDNGKPKPELIFGSIFVKGAVIPSFDSGFDLEVDEKIETPNVDVEEKTKPENDFIFSTEKYIKENLDSKKLPRDWKIGDKSEKWCSLVRKCIDELDLSDVSTSKEIKALLGSDYKSSIVLYNEEELTKILDNLSD